MSVETSPQTLEPLNFLTPNQINQLVQKYGSPIYVYSEAILRDRAAQALAFEAPYGLTVRYAMKANPLAGILRIFNEAGLHIDASSDFEVYRAIKAGIDPTHIMLTSQQLPKNMTDIVSKGVIFNACSLHQLETYGKLYPGTTVSIRINPGLGSGHSRSVSVAGPTSSFGIWHEQSDAIHALLKKYALSVSTVHSHIGCGTDPKIWQQAARLTLKLIEQFPTATTLNLGGGFKVARMSYETATNLRELSGQVSHMLTEFADRTGRKLHLEIEPGTFMVANAGALIAKVIDMTNTGDEGFSFIKVDAGMNDLMRPALHGSQQPIIVINNRPQDPREYVVVGHNCESTDLLTPAPTDSERPYPRLLQEAAIGDTIVIEGVDAYGSAMALIGYNSFPTPNEVLLTRSGEFKILRNQESFNDFIIAER